jgi:hypothetical protein
MSDEVPCSVTHFSTEECLSVKVAISSKDHSHNRSDEAMEVEHE